MFKASGIGSLQEVNIQMEAKTLHIFRKNVRSFCNVVQKLLRFCFRFYAY